MNKYALFFVLILIKLFLVGCTTIEDKPKSTKKYNSNSENISEAILFSTAILIIEKNHINGRKIKKIAFINSVKGMEEEVARKGYDLSKLKFDWESKGKFDHLRYFVKSYQYFVKNTDIPPKDLIYTSIRSTLKELDASSYFLTPKEFEEMRLNSKIGGIGIEFTVGDDFLTVVSTINKSPAFNGGIKKGDKILKIENKEVNGLRFYEIKKLLRGSVGSAITILVKRKNTDKPMLFEVNRSVVKSQNVKHSILEGNLAYVKIGKFNANTDRDLKKSLVELNAEVGELGGLVLDLRNNPGGVLRHVVAVADMFLESGLIVFTEGKIQDYDKKYEAGEEGTQPNYPIAILVNKETASGSEVLAGALQYWERAFILGTPTFGAGYIQMLFSLPDDSMLALSSARFFTPGGHPIQDNGITPDIMVELTQPESLGDLQSDTQLQRAVNILKSRQNN